MLNEKISAHNLRYNYCAPDNNEWIYLNGQTKIVYQ